jgi:hypothetical protein
MLIASLAVTARAWERGHPGTGGPLDLFARRGLNALILFVSFAVVPAGIYLASYVRWFGGPTIPYGWNLVELTQQMYWYHSGLTAPHPAGSPWWSWPFVLKPVYWYFGAAGGGDNAYIYDAGNVALFWAGLVAFGWCAVAAVRARSVPLLVVVFAALAQYVAWIPIGRVLFFYHFFTVLPFYLLALAAGLAYLWETGRARLVVGYLAITVAVFAYFYPFISAQPFPGAQAGMFFILPTWTYECTFYPTFVCNPTIGSSFAVSALFGRLALALAVAAIVATLISWSDDDRGQEGEDEVHDVVPQARESERPARGVQDDRDVVLAAARLREIDERGRRAIEIHAADRRRDLAIGNVTRQPVGAEQEPVAWPQRLEEHVGLHAARIADESRDRALVFAGVVGRDETDVAVAQQIRAAVAEVSDHGRSVGDRGCDERRCGPLVSALAGGAQHRIVRAADRRSQRLRGAHRARAGAEETLRERVDRRGARELASGLAADAVGHREEGRLASLADEVAIFVVLANTTGVGACRRLRSQP